MKTNNLYAQLSVGQGPAGPVGPQGPKGDKGDKGDTGAVGPQGPKGDKGERGARGERGLTGPTGLQGERGAQGPEGQRGPQGIQGPKGDKGDKGEKGDTPSITHLEEAIATTIENVETRAENCLPIIEKSATAKVDYTGQEHKSLKESMDANVEFTLGEVNRVHYEGQYITALDSLAGQAKNAVVEGQTLVNLVKNPSDKKIVGKSSDTKAKYKYLYQLDTTKTYTLQFVVSDFNGSTSFSCSINNGNQHIYDFKINGNGTYKVLTQSASGPSTELWFYWGGNSWSDENTAKVSNIVFIEGDYTNVDIPYFEGMTSVKAPVLHSVGKNLFDGVSYIDGFITQGNDYTVSPDTDVSSILVNVNKNTDYILSAKTNFSRSIVGGSLTPISIGTKTTKIHNERVGNTIKFNSGIYTNIIIYLNETKINIEEIQVEEASAATPFEPYKSNTLSTPEDLELRGIGKIKDELNVATGELTQRIGEIVLDGSDDEEWITASGGSATHKRFVLKRGNRIKPISNVNENKFLCDKFKTVKNITGENSQEMCLMEGYDDWYVSIIIDNTKLNSIDVDGFKLWLQSNPVKFNYVIEDESIKTVDLSDNHVYSYQETTHYSFEAKDNSLIPTLSLDVPTKLNALVARQKDTIQELTQENESLKAAQQILLNSQLSFYESLVYAIPSLMPVVEGQAIIPDFIQDLYRLENNQK